jgi:hypothetical protein
MKVYDGAAWDLVAPDTSNFIDKSILTGKGSIISASSASTPSVLTVASTNGYILSVDSSTTTGLAWIANDQGDITAVSAGTGITVASSTGPIPTVSLDTSSAYVLPSQSGNSGKYLTTDGSTASWATIATDPAPTALLFGGM